MNSVKNDILKDQKLLTRFISKLRLLPDTPSLIQFVAGDEDYMRLCRRIVNASVGDSHVSRQFTEICRKHGLDFQVLKERLTPAALALGLADASENQSNYYELLGISSDAPKADIKKAFRQKVRQVHPDTSDQTTDNGQDFINLKAAYQILSDPVLRRQYDETLPDENFWEEKGNPPVNQKRPGRTKILYQLGVLILLMILAVFIFDFLYRQNSIFDGDPPVEQRQLTEPKTVKDKSPIKSDIKTQSQNKGMRLLRYRSTRIHRFTQIRSTNIKTTLKAEGSMLKAQSDPQITRIKLSRKHEIKKTRNRKSYSRVNIFKISR